MERLKRFIQEYKISFAIVFIFLLECMRGSYDLKAWSFLRQMNIMTFLTIGVSLEMMSGDFDLAFAAQISLSTITAALLISAGLPVWTACIVIIGLNAILGCLKGFLLTKLKMPSIIFTLALQVIFLNLFSGVLPDNRINFSDILVLHGNRAAEVLVTGLLILTVCGMYYFLNNTYYGKYCRMLGENMELAEKSGLNCMAISMIIHVIASLFFSIPAISIMLYTSSGSTYMGANYLYKVLAAVCLGGIGFQNGKGSVNGMVIGALTVVTMLMMLTGSGYLNRFETILEGIIILLALDVKNRTKN